MNQYSMTFVHRKVLSVYSNTIRFIISKQKVYFKTQTPNIDKGAVPTSQFSFSLLFCHKDMQA